MLQKQGDWHESEIIRIKRNNLGRLDLNDLTLPSYIIDKVTKIARDNCQIDVDIERLSFNTIEIPINKSVNTMANMVTIKGINWLVPTFNMLLYRLTLVSLYPVTNSMAASEA